MANLIIVTALRRNTSRIVDKMAWDEFDRKRSEGRIGDTRYMIVSCAADPERFKGLNIDGIIEVDKPSMSLGVELSARLVRTKKNKSHKLFQA